MPVVIASSFADPADVVAYKAAIAAGKTEAEALAAGDNGIGYWGDDTTSDALPMCALPYEVWEDKWGPGTAARGKKVSVKYDGKTILGELRDTMPHLANISNGAGIDLNPGFAKALSVKPPFLLSNVTWNWA